MDCAILVVPGYLRFWTKNISNRAVWHRTTRRKRQTAGWRPILWVSKLCLKAIPAGWPTQAHDRVGNYTLRVVGWSFIKRYDVARDVSLSKYIINVIITRHVVEKVLPVLCIMISINMLIIIRCSSRPQYPILSSIICYCSVRVIWFVTIRK